ncbi:MAG: alkaline shock response membrane anchor protein AmaP [Clostridiales bacterium]|nr:alkaline shock response membrane anchor protein AmaP [Clostridiales bacterium]
MRLRIWDRILIALSGLLVLFVSICVFVVGTGIFPFQLDLSFLDRSFELWQRIAIVAVALVLFALSIHNIFMLFRRRKDKGFIIQRTEYGNMSISMNALENMVKKCVDSHPELSVGSTKIHKGRDGIVVDIKITLLSGVNIPLTVNALQKQIKQYITSCSGVDVQQVRVMVETSTAQPAKLGEASVSEVFVPIEPEQSAQTAQPTASAPENGAHLIFSHTEEPEQCPKPEAVEVPHEEETAVIQEEATHVSEDTEIEDDASPISQEPQSDDIQMVDEIAIEEDED